MTARSIYFPLSSNISYFETESPQPNLEQRVKEASILADELRFEAGTLNVSVADTIVTMWHPPGSRTRGEIRELREMSRQGIPLSLRIGREAIPGEPASSMHEIARGPLQRAFVAEYETLLDESGLGEQSWVGFGVVDDAAESHVDARARMIRWEAPPTQAPALSTNPLLDGQFKSNLVHDLATAALIGSQASVDAMHMTYARFLTVPGGPSEDVATGGQALRALVPDLRSVPWQTVIEWHQREAMCAFREKLVEWEADAASRPLDQRDNAVLHRATVELARDLASRMRRWPDMTDLLFEAMGLAGVLVPSGLGFVPMIAELVSRWEEGKVSWAAVFFELQESSGGEL